MSREWAIKRLSRREKEELIRKNPPRLPRDIRIANRIVAQH